MLKMDDVLLLLRPTSILLNYERIFVRVDVILLGVDSMLVGKYRQ